VARLTLPALVPDAFSGPWDGIGGIVPIWSGGPEAVLGIVGTRSTRSMAYKLYLLSPDSLSVRDSTIGAEFF
jgi:hypothetical protein